MIRRHGISAIWSTYPVASAHSIGATLARISGLPWVADFRDPMVEYVERIGEHFPQDARLRNARLKVESRVVRRASKLVFCTDAARQILLRRHPEVSQGRTAIITNGYDEQEFLEAERTLPSRPREGKLVLLHSGVVYLGSDRDPRPLFEAIRRLAAAGQLGSENFELRFRSPSNENQLRSLIQDSRIGDLVSILPPVPYTAALQEMMQVDGLLLLQGFTSNPAVPAKLYEYLRAGRQIVALVDGDGETAATLRDAKIDSVADIASVDDIVALLQRWLGSARLAHPAVADPGDVRRYSRELLAGRLAELLDAVHDPAGSGA